jgi:hypothetical protein
MLWNISGSRVAYVRPFFPVRANVHPTSSPSTLAAIDATLERRHLDVVGIARHVDQRRVPARIVVAVADQAMHALPAHVPSVIGGPGVECRRAMFHKPAIRISLLA